MAAYDNAEMPRAPTQYGPPLANFGAQIASLPDSYYQGAEQRRDYDLKRAFSGGIPRDANGQLDYNSMADTLVRKGGVDQALQVANTGAQLEASKNFSGMMSGQPQQQPRPTAPVFAPAPQQPQQQPQLSARGTDNNGSDTVRSVMTETFGGRDVSASIPSIAKRVGVGEDDPLTPSQVAQLKQTLAPSQGRMQPQQAPQPQQQQQASTIPPALAGLIPANWPGTVQSFRDRIAAAATSPMLPPASQKVAQERLKAIDAAIAKDAERTPEMKNAAASGVTSPAQLKMVEEQQKQQVDSYRKKYDTIDKAGMEADHEQPKLELGLQIMSRPDFVSGFLNDPVQTYRKVLAQIDPSQAGAAAPQEVFKKLASDGVRSKIQQFAQSGVGRIMLSEVRIMEKSAANADLTTHSNRALFEMDRRAGQMLSGLRDIAQNYNGGVLDPGYDKAATAYVQQHKMFSPEELKNPKLLGAPVAPPVQSPQEVAAWIKSMGLKSGDAIRLADGRYKQVP